MGRDGWGGWAAGGWLISICGPRTGHLVAAARQKTPHDGNRQSDTCSPCLLPVCFSLQAGHIDEDGADLAAEAAEMQVRCVACPGCGQRPAGMLCFLSVACSAHTRPLSTGYGTLPMHVLATPNGPCVQAALAHAPVYEVASTGARVTLENASLLLHAYVLRLPADQYTVLRPLYRTGVCIMPVGDAAVAAGADGTSVLSCWCCSTGNLHLCLCFCLSCPPVAQS